MLIHIHHPEYSGIEIKGESLFIHPIRGESRLLLEGVTDVVAAVDEGLIHIVVFMGSKDYAWHLYGRESFNRDRFELGQVYGGGARLVLDDAGKVHLLHLTRQSPGRGALLKHRIFSQSWAAPLAVSSDVSTQGLNLSAAWHSDGYLHIVYCCHREQHLYYRVFDPQQGVWSGAIPFSRKRCSNPHLIPAARLYLFWQEEDAKIGLFVREKEAVWSETRRISEQNAHTSGVGFAVEEGAWSIFWREQAKFYRAILGGWPDRKEEAAEQYAYVWAVEGGIMIPAYMPGMLARSKPPLEEEVVDDRVAVVREEQTKKGAEVQSAFIKQAFHVLQEWERMKEEISRWRREMPVPEPVDLTTVLNRCERLERRYVSLGQMQKQQLEEWRDEFDKVRIEFSRIQRRLQDLEQAQKRRRTGFWHRLLEKD